MPGKRACKNKKEYKESKSTEATYVIGRNRRCMGLKRDISFSGLLQALEILSYRNLLDRSLVTLTAASCSTGLSAITGEVEGAAGASFGGSSSSLQKEKQVMYNTTDTRQEKCN
jgi:hypothetical protein